MGGVSFSTMARVNFWWSCALATLLAACSSDDGGRGAPPSCSFVSISRSGGLCDLTLSCGGATVGLSCSDADCVCTAGGMGGARFAVSGACGMSNDGLAALYQSRCPAAGGDGGANDGGMNDAVVTTDQPPPEDVPTVDAEPEAATDAPPMCTALGRACSASSECCGTVPMCGMTLVSSSRVCCKAQGTTCGGTSGSCCAPYVCRVISGSIRACS